TEVRMIRALWTILERREERLDYLMNAVSAKRMYSLAQEARQRLDYLSERLESAEARELQTRMSRLELAQGRLRAVGPQATLSRGYAIARSADGLILTASDARPGQEIELILGRGRLLCRVLECREEKEAIQ
ncbi:MAG: exodeoxyribonuclease large subunit, partial [Euryarchaeota archaeon]|nr:exodeoxyribonuclease large subunit [Euryarchaeota archaeon]